MPPDETVVLVGETEMLTGGLGGVTTIAALACFLESARLVTVTVTMVFVLTLGAVKRPFPETVPALAHQVTAVLPVLRTVAANCCVPADETFALLGEIEMLTGERLTSGTTTMASCLWPLAATSLTVTVKLYVPATLGLPETKPVAESRFNPGGSASAKTENA